MNSSATGGTMDLEHWIEKSGLRKKFVAEDLGITLKYFYALCRKELKPSKRLARDIEEYTNGCVTIKDLILQKEEETVNEN
jgi:hypothetical protein